MAHIVMASVVKTLHRYTVMAFVGESDPYIVMPYIAIAHIVMASADETLYSYGQCRGVRPVSECAVRLALQSISRHTAVLEATRLLRLGRRRLCCHRDIVMAYIVMDYIVMAYVVMAYVVMADIVMAYRSAGPFVAIAI